MPSRSAGFTPGSSPASFSVQVTPYDVKYGSSPAQCKGCVLRSKRLGWHTPRESVWITGGEVVVIERSCFLAQRLKLGVEACRVVTQLRYGVSPDFLGSLV